MQSCNICFSRVEWVYCTHPDTATSQLVPGSRESALICDLQGPLSDDYLGSEATTEVLSVDDASSGWETDEQGAEAVAASVDEVSNGNANNELYTCEVSKSLARDIAFRDSRQQGTGTLNTFLPCIAWVGDLLCSAKSFAYTGLSWPTFWQSHTLCFLQAVSNHL